MYLLYLMRTFLISATIIPIISAQSSITDPTKRAEFALSALQIWYNAGTGLWNTCGWWNSANVMTTVANLAKRDPNPQLQSLCVRLFANTLTQAPAKNPQPGVEGSAVKRRNVDNQTFALFNGTGLGTGYDKIADQNGQPVTVYPEDWDKADGPYIDVTSLPIYKTSGKITVAAADVNDWLDGFYDDDLWWALGWIGAYDVTGDTEYLALAENIFKAVTKAWPSTCGGGGIYWSWKKDYVNAIANELFLSTAAHLANRAPDKTFYLDWAKKELDWFLSTGMINERGTINDGLDSACKNNNQVCMHFSPSLLSPTLIHQL